MVRRQIVSHTSIGAELLATACAAKAEGADAWIETTCTRYFVGCTLSAMGIRGGSRACTSFLRWRKSSLREFVAASDGERQFAGMRVCMQMRWPPLRAGRFSGMIIGFTHP